MLNTSVCQVGCENFVFGTYGLANISELLKNTCEKLIQKLSQPIATADKRCGIQIFENVHGAKMLMLTDYSYYGSSEKERVVSVMFDRIRVKQVSFAGTSPNGQNVHMLKEQDEVLGFSVKIRQREALLFCVEE